MAILSPEAADEFGAVCFEAGSCGLQTEEGPEGILVRAYFPPEIPVATAAGRLQEGLAQRGPGRPRVVWERQPERDWLGEWRTHYRPVWATERIAIHPPWLSVRLRPGQIAIAVEPRMAFGTGGHESTQLALQGIEAHARAGMSCLDLGTGSGVLGIALVRLGAARVVAVDVDGEAVANAHLNGAANLGEESRRLSVRLGSLEVVPERGFDLVVANLESRLLRPLMAPLRDRLRDGGAAVLSGVLRSEERPFAAALAEWGLRTAGRWHRHGWVCLAARREGGT